MFAERNHRLTRSHLIGHTSQNKWGKLKTFFESLLVCNLCLILASQTLYYYRNRFFLFEEITSKFEQNTNVMVLHKTDIFNPFYGHRLLYSHRTMPHSWWWGSNPIFWSSDSVVSLNKSIYTLLSGVIKMLVTNFLFPLCNTYTWSVQSLL